MTVCMGLDIGYSNLKFSISNNNSVQESVCPAGAGPFTKLPGDFMKGSNRDDLIIVSLDDVQWGAGVDPDKFEDTVRVVEKDYMNTESYRALFYAALLKSGADEVDHLVTGLPVEQALDPIKVEQLTKKLQGEHQVTNAVTVNVKKVSVLPQPAGAYMHYVSKSDVDLKNIEDSKILVIDPGYFSFDWVVIDCGSVRKNSSGHNVLATSKIIDLMTQKIQMDYGSPVPSRIENALRTGSVTIKVSGRDVSVTPYLEAAKGEIAQQAVQDLLNKMRNEDGEPDIVIMAGGAAKYYTQFIKDKFATENFMCEDDSVLANARGFLYYAKSAI